MPASLREETLCRYSYDPLDRQTGCILLSLPVILRFYCKSRLVTEIQGALHTSVFQHDDQLIAQQRQQDGKVITTLLETDQQQSVLGANGVTGLQLLAYTPYGHRMPNNSFLGFNGEWPDPVTGRYHLGNGYRQFNPVLMRFNSPDSWSPFGDGGLNNYGYCEGDPINSLDPAGHASQFLLAIRNFFRPNTRPLAAEPVHAPHTSQSPIPQTTRSRYRNPLANVEVNIPVAARPTSTPTPTPTPVNTDGTVDRASYPPSYFQRPDSPPPVYRSSPFSRAPNTPGELPPTYEKAKQDPAFDVRVKTRRTGLFRRQDELSVRLIRNQDVDR